MHNDEMQVAYSFFSCATSKESNRLSMHTQSFMYEPNLCMTKLEQLIQQNEAPKFVMIIIYIKT